jgi:sugar lactone lactonase YvrE
MRPLTRALLGVAILPILYLAMWPVDLVPVGWDPPRAPGFKGPFASNGKLAQHELLAADLPGPEAVARDATGQLVTGTLDGRVVRVDASGKAHTLARTGGRPLSVKPLPDGSLVVADAHRGLLRVADGKVTPIVTGYRGVRFKFTDDVDVLPDGRVVFTDASQRRGLGEFELDALEHSGTGVVYVCDPKTGSVDRLHGNLQFANGVAASGDGSVVLVNETWAYRVRRIFLHGPRAGESDIVIDNLPGFPDNITYDRLRDLFWVAIASPRDFVLDLLAPLPALRKVVARLPESLHPKAKRHAMALAIHPSGKVAHFFDDPSPDSYSPVTGVYATEDALYLSSFQHHGIARVKLSGLGVSVAKSR